MRAQLERNDRSGTTGVTVPRGTVRPLLLPRDGFYARGYPRDMPRRYRLRSAFKEFALRARLAPKGFVRGLRGTGIIGVGRLYASVIRANGDVEHLGLVCTRLVTDAGVNYIRDDWNGGSNIIDNFNYHGCGTGNTAESAGDTALVTESTTALNPDSTRATGTKSVPGTGQCRTVGTATFDATAAITEHGIFTQAATGGGTLLDRSVFSAINVASGDSIQFTYTLTLSSGG
jgi:hypothetical protein